MILSLPLNQNLDVMHAVGSREMNVSKNTHFKEIGNSIQVTGRYQQTGLEMDDRRDYSQSAML